MKKTRTLIGPLAHLIMLNVNVITSGVALLSRLTGLMFSVSASTGQTGSEYKVTHIQVKIQRRWTIIALRNLIFLVQN